MKTQALRDATPEIRDHVDRLVARLVFRVGAALCLIAALGFALLPLALPAGRQAWLAVACGGVALFMGGLGWSRPAPSAARAGAFAGWVVIALVTFVSVLLGEGVHTMVLGFYGVMISVAIVTAGLRAGLAMTLCCAAVVVALAAADLHLGPSAAPPARLWLHVLLQLLLLGAALALGIVLARTTTNYLVVMAEREQRFRGLLQVAAEWYWELDTDFRFTRVDADPGLGSALPAERCLGRRPWEIEGFGLDAEAMAEHRAVLAAQQPFDNVLVCRHDAAGHLHYARLFGAPRLDPQGRYCGWWGVGRDVTNEVLAQLGRASSEARYRELFERSPTPLVLVRAGRVIDANPAAITLFGHPTLAALLGRDVGEQCDGAEAAARVRESLGRLDRLAPGESLDPVPLALIGAEGRRLTVIVTGVRVDMADGPATLAIFFDDTERRSAEDAVRRSEALLSHLVATSPDVITLTELDSGRFVRVNETFTTLLGYADGEVIGRSAEALGLWADPGAGALLVQQLALSGNVKNHPAEFVGKSGRVFPMLVSAARFAMDGRDYMVINARDLTASERSRLEREAILENASIGIALTRDRAFIMANPRFEQMFGWPAGALVGQPGQTVWLNEADYRAVGIEVGPALARGDQVEFERIMARRDGSSFLCRMLARAVDPSHPSRGSTIWIAEDVTERRAVELALARARDDAEAANRAKSAFLANTSHEIRTPLNGLVGMARLARQSGLDEARRSLYLEQISDSAEALAAIISDILDLSKIEAGKLDIEAVPFDLHELLETQHRGYETLADARSLRLGLEIAPGVPHWVSGDPLRVRQILGNYLSNAIKFTPRGSVLLRAERLAGNGVRFEVHDSGPGLDAATRERLFRPFTQADQSTTRRYGGTGLGLSICRELAGLMGGSVGVDSEPGHGSTFWADLRLPPAEAEDPEATLDTLHGGLLEGAHVLMVEDNSVNMMIGVALLRQWGLRVEQAGNGVEAVEAVDAAAARGEPFDLVLMDMQMPVMDGYQAALTLRERYGPARLPIVALTAAALLSEREQALAAGMNEFLTKPIEPRLLRRTLMRVLAGEPDLPD